MSRMILPAAGLGGAIPPDLKCGFCQRPVRDQFYRTLNRFSCSACAAKVQGIIQRNIVTPQAWAAAAVVGLLVSLACAAAWAAIVHDTHYEIGIVASFIGVAVAKAVYQASGKRRGLALQWLAAVLSLIGVAGGKLMLDSWDIVDYLHGKGVMVTPALLARILSRMAWKAPSSLFDGFDLLWIAIAVYAAWRLCKAPPITIAGPFPVSPSGGAGLQFETIEPADSSTPPEAP